MARKIDGLGRIVPPIELRRQYGIEGKEVAAVIPSDKGILIMEATDSTKAMVRKVDGLGRIVIPIEYRREYQLVEHEPVSIQATPDGILVSRIVKDCLECGTSENLVAVGLHQYCLSCLKKFSVVLSHVQDSTPIM